jgi:hypothetical protein
MKGKRRSWSREIRMRYVGNGKGRVVGQLAPEKSSEKAVCGRLQARFRMSRRGANHCPDLYIEAGLFHLVRSTPHHLTSF